MLVTTGNPADPEVLGNDIPAQQPSASSSLATVDVIIPESVDNIKLGMTCDQEQGRSQPLLPSIGVFLSKTCTIPLIRCNLDQIKKKVESQCTQPNIIQQISDKMESMDTGINADTDKEGTGAEINHTKSRTSTRPRTVIDYRKFLEDYTDEPPSPSKKKRAVDLKRKPSKTRIAANKYSRSKYHTKPSHVLRPARRGMRTNPPAAPLASDVTQAEVTNPIPQSEKTTATVPATSQETQEAIEALLLLGEPPIQANLGEDDNATLMLIVGGNKASVDPLPSVPPLPDVKLASSVNPVPKPGTLLGVAIKTDRVDNPTPTEDEMDDTQETVDTQTENLDTKKKTFITKEYGLQKRVKSKRKFKCGVCAMELEMVKDYNQHYLDNHPPMPCPHCPCLFSSPHTMAKHKYSHDEIMFECETCGQGFTFKSQY